MRRMIAHGTLATVILVGGALIGRLQGACHEYTSSTSTACVSSLNLCGSSCTALSSQTCSTWTDDDDVVHPANVRDKLLDTATAPRSCTYSQDPEDGCFFDFRNCYQTSPCYMSLGNCVYANVACSNPQSVAYYYDNDTPCQAE